METLACEPSLRREGDSSVCTIVVDSGPESFTISYVSGFQILFQTVVFHGIFGDLLSCIEGMWESRAPGHLSFIGCTY